MVSVLAPATPEVLRWARTSADVDLDTAAKRAKVTPERVDGWERGNEPPTLAKLRDLAKLYQRPLAVFFLPEPPLDFDAMRDFRRLAGGASRAWSRPMHKVFRRAIEQRDTLAEIAEAGDELTRDEVPSASVGDDVDRTARRARRSLGVELAEQFAWESPDEGLRTWIEAVEDLGVMVLRTSEVPIEEMRGFSIAESDVPPVVVLNALDSKRGQIFTLLHEFTHLMLRAGGLCNLLDRPDGEEHEVELWCNAVAAAILMPSVAFLNRPNVMPLGEREWDDHALGVMSEEFTVSREAVLRRLVELGRASWGFYMNRRAAYIEAYRHSDELLRAKRRERPGGPPPHRMVLRDRGKPFVRVALDAYHRGVLTDSSLSAVLGLKVRHFADIERESRA
jgi:Zn-dependent peptidase ImmA (M78 family)